MRAPKRWRGKKGGKKAEKVAEFCEKVENYCSKVPMFSRICFAKLTATLQWGRQSVDDRGETAVDHLRTKKNLPFAARNAVKGEVEWGDWHFDRAALRPDVAGGRDRSPFSRD